MKTSNDRILTTHVGSLPRSPTLSDLLIRQERGEKIDLGQLRKENERAYGNVVRQQIAAGIDIINDGEQPRVGFQTYVPLRMKGFGGESKRATPQDFKTFPELAEIRQRRFPNRSKSYNAPMALAEVRYDDLNEAIEEIDLFDAASLPLDARVADRFMTAASPGIIATTMVNGFYDSHERYVFALAREMRKEYKLIVDRGLVLQLDAPDLAMERTIMFQDKPLG